MDQIAEAVPGSKASVDRETRRQGDRENSVSLPFSRRTKFRRLRGFSLTELIAVIAILGVLAVLVVPRLSDHQVTSKKSACYANQGDIELQVKLWKRANGTYPAANLSDIGASTTYFPSGVPVCPVDGMA